MALDNALHFLDDLKGKYMHEVEKAIEDWDYQDFSPDKRTPLLENEITGDVVEDSLPENNALQQIKDAQTLDWAGLSRDEMLAEQAYGISMASSAGSGMTYEARVVAMATPIGGVQGIPDADSIQRFLRYTPVMNASIVADAFYSRLQQTSWQIRAKALVLMELLLESADFMGMYVPAFKSNKQLTVVVDTIRTQDHNPIARENARKVMSLIHSNGASSTVIAREPAVAKSHVHHAATMKTKKPAVDTASIGSAKPKLSVATASSPGKPKSAGAGQHHYQATSPKIAAAALASWRRRTSSQTGMNDVDPIAGLTNPHGKKSPTPMRPATAVAAAAPLQKNGSIRMTGANSSSAFAFIDQKPQQQKQRVSITASSSRSQVYR